MIRVFAPAKINLTLKVGAPRNDGLHPLASVVAFADVGDWVEAALGDELSLALTGPFANGLEREADNLVVRAARALREATGVQFGAALTLDKRLPIASGIGGGSSDAAATLKALNGLWALGLGEAELSAIGSSFGADIPVCVGARAAYMTGIGEVLQAVHVPRLHGVLINALTPVPTAAVYRVFDEMSMGGGFETPPPPVWPDAASAWAGATALGNDLLAPACKVAPSLSYILAILRADPRARHVALSGSGGTLFALVESADAAAALARDVARPDWWVRATILE